MRKGYFAAGVACLVLCALCIVKCFPTARPSSPVPVRQATKAVAEQSVSLLHGGEETEPTNHADMIDFETMKESNEDIYAWL